MNHSALLKNSGLKVTPKRVALIETLYDEMVYLSPEEVWNKLKPKVGRIGLPTVYRNLEQLARYGVITKVMHPNRQLYYFLCANACHHHHFVCLQCRKVEDIPHCNIAELEEQVSDRFNAKVLSHILQLNGVCETCLRKDHERS